MRKAALALGLLLVTVAGAAEAFYPGERVDRVWGQLITFSSTNHALAPNFEAEWVQICLHNPTQEVVYIREGKTLAEATTSDTGSVTSANFIAGVSGSYPLRAYVLGSDVQLTNGRECDMLPWKVDGLVLHAAATGTASVDVNFYDTTPRHNDYYLNTRPR